MKITRLLRLTLATACLIQSLALAHTRQAGVLVGTGRQPELSCADSLEEKVVVAVVEGLSSGALFPAELRKIYGKKLLLISVIANNAMLDAVVPGTPQSMREKMGYVRNDYDLELRFDANNPEEVSRAVNTLGAFKDLKIWAGSEDGVTPYNLLSSKLAQSNPSVLSNGNNPAHRNKFLAKSAVKNALADYARTHPDDEDLGYLKLPEFIGSTNVESIISWEKRFGFFKLGSGFIVLQAPEGAGKEKTFFCRNEDEIRSAFAQIYQKSNGMGGVSNLVVATQGILTGPGEGQEFGVQTNSSKRTAKSEAVVKISDIQRYNDKVGGVYGFDTVEPYNGAPHVRRLEKFSRIVHKALRLNYGWGHGEFIVDKFGTVWFLEMNPRAIGSMMPLMVAASTADGHNHITRGILAMTDFSAFEKLPNGYEIKYHAAAVMLSSQVGGKRFSLQRAQALEQRPGVHRAFWSMDDNQSVVPCTHLGEAIGKVFVVADSREELLKRVAEIRHAVAEGLLFKADDEL